ncbi:uncharacterized protein Dvir_GJ18034, isoform D [Drosophila virilis]|uniref:Uncharacterized protein, isoform D n=1 Tax=Drosophila virilis TaxID=7244 RepID=A0A0Q9VYE3_DROVI|nr:uncharacterized protein LOC6634305 isoform X2 [Drosophila virilis]KRF77849.1 uncharacterized protein Dvir_GJ18034, isoform D [Drosophila virilis]
MAEEEHQPAVGPHKSPLGLSPADFAHSVPVLLWKLGIALGCKRPMLEHHVEVAAPETKININLNHFRQRFRQLHSMEDTHDQVLDEHRYKLFLHLYRLLTRLEPNESKRQQYLLFCYNLFDTEKPQQVHLDEKLRYQEHITESLISVARNVMHLNEENSERPSEVRSINIENFFPMPKRCCPPQILEVGFAIVEYSASKFSCNSKGLLWEQASYKISYIQARKAANSKNIREEPKPNKDDEMEVIFMLNWNSPAKSFSSSSELMLYEDIGIQLTECNSNNRESRAAEICEKRRDIIKETAEQTELHHTLSDQGVQTNQSAFSDIATNTDDELLLVQINGIETPETGTSTGEMFGDIDWKIREKQAISTKVMPEFDRSSEYRQFTTTKNPTSLCMEQVKPSVWWANQHVTSPMDHFLLTTSEEMLSQIGHTITEQEPMVSSPTMHQNSITSRISSSTHLELRNQYPSYYHRHYIFEESLAEIDLPIMEQELITVPSREQQESTVSRVYSRVHAETSSPVTSNWQHQAQPNIEQSIAQRESISTTLFTETDQYTLSISEQPTLTSSTASWQQLWQDEVSKEMLPEIDKSIALQKLMPEGSILLERLPSPTGRQQDMLSDPVQSTISEEDITEKVTSDYRLEGVNQVREPATWQHPQQPKDISINHTINQQSVPDGSIKRQKSMPLRATSSVLLERLPSPTGRQQDMLSDSVQSTISEEDITKKVSSDCRLEGVNQVREPATWQHPQQPKDISINHTINQQSVPDGSIKRQESMPLRATSSVILERLPSPTGRQQDLLSDPVQSITSEEDITEKVTSDYRLEGVNQVREPATWQHPQQPKDISINHTINQQSVPDGSMKRQESISLRATSSVLFARSKRVAPPTGWQPGLLSDSVPSITSAEDISEQKTGDCLLEIVKQVRELTTWQNPQQTKEMSINQTISRQSMSDETITRQQSITKWQHQRHVIAASRFIVKQFQCNPAYQCSPMERDAPNFFAQWTQFHEIVATQAKWNQANRNPTLDVVAIRRRLKAFLRCMRKKYSFEPEECVAAIAKCQIQQLLTADELREYETMRWQQRDRGTARELSHEERLQDALHGMLGYECQQLRSSALGPRLMLRSPHHQRSVSESYLLLSLAEVGYYYRCLQQLQKHLQQLGECGRALTPCLLAELLNYSEFYKRQKVQPKSLLHLFWQTRSYRQRFQWLLQICGGFSRRQPLLQYLQLQLGQGNAACDMLLQLWLRCAAEPLLARISSWLLRGELPADEFFIVKRRSDNYLVEHYWTQQFELVQQQLPYFLSQALALQLLGAGRNQHYARQFLGRQLELTLSDAEMREQLAAACASSYRELDVQPLAELVTGLQLQTSRELLQQLHQASPQPLELLSRLHQYWLLTDVEFVRELIELLEPALEQPAEYFNPKQLNKMLEQLLCAHNENLYVVKGDHKGSQSWCCFLLRWQQPAHWLPLLGARQLQYETSFACLWQLHYADYVLNERIRRHQAHFWERINLAHSKDARHVRDRFEQFSDRLQEFMLQLRSYMLQNVLGSAYERLYFGCSTSKTLDELLELHGAYLESIEYGIMQRGKCGKLQHYLGQLYASIIHLDAVQQKFLSLGQLFNQRLNKRESAQQLLLELRWSCQNTCDAINDLEHDFQLVLAQFLTGLYATGETQLQALAKKLDRHGYYEQRFRELKEAQTFKFQRKLKTKRKSQFD